MVERIFRKFYIKFGENLENLWHFKINFEKS